MVTLNMFLIVEGKKDAHAGIPDLIAYCSEQPPINKDVTAKFNNGYF